MILAILLSLQAESITVLLICFDRFLTYPSLFTENDTYVEILRVSLNKHD